MKVVSFAKSLRLIFRRRKVILQQVDRKAMRQWFILAACYISCLVLLLMAFPPLTLLATLLRPSGRNIWLSLPSGTLTLNLSAECLSILSVIDAMMLMFLAAYLWASLSYAYQRCLNLIPSDAVLSADHGGTLAEVLRGLRAEPVEYLAIFAPDGKKIDETTNLNCGMVSCHPATGDYMRQMSGCVKVHNHPGSSSGFSEGDIAAAIYYRVSKTIVVAQKYVYTLELAPECWEYDWEKVQETLKKGLQYLDTLGKQPNDGEITAFALGINASFAVQYGMKLTVERFENCSYLRAGTSCPHSTGAKPAPSNASPKTVVAHFSKNQKKL